MKIDLKVPEPLLVKENILIMSFIGENGIPAKRLRDMKFDLAQYSEYYLKVIYMI